jgi:hypothetical protein
MHVETLEPRSIGDHPLSDPAEPQDDKPAAATDCQQGDGSSDEDGDHLRQDCLQPPLQRPDESDDEEGESHGCHHGTCRPQARQREDRCAYRRRRAQRAVVSQGSAPCQHRGAQNDHQG